MQYHRTQTRSLGRPGVAVALITALCIAACVSVKETKSREARPSEAMTGVMFQSIPGDAEVWVNGDFRGTTPLHLDLAAGTHTVELRLQGHATWKRELVVVAGDDTRVSARLEPESL